MKKLTMITTSLLFAITILTGLSARAETAIATGPDGKYGIGISLNTADASIKALSNCGFGCNIAANFHDEIGWTALAISTSGCIGLTYNELTEDAALKAASREAKCTPGKDCAVYKSWQH